MNYKYPFAFLFIISLSLPSLASFNYNARCTEAYKAIYHLKLNDARILIREEKQQDPQNGVTILLDNYVDFFSLLMSDNKADYEKFSNYRSGRIDALENSERNSPYYLYSQGVVYLQWGILKAKFGDYFSSFLDIKKARALFRENAQKYPDFLPNQINTSLIDVVLDALPSNLKGVAKFFGMSGNAKAGLAQLEKIRTEIGTTKYSLYTDDVTFTLCYINIDILHNPNSYNQLIGYVKAMDNNNNALKDYLGGYLCAKTAHNDEAIEFLEAINDKKQQLVLPVVDYLLGNARLCRMDSDASIYLLKYISEYKDYKYIKDAYLKVAYAYFLSNNLSKYYYYLNMARTKGNALDEKDKQALREANDGPPNIDLLKARLYYDGGYYNKAVAQLQDKQLTDFKLLRDQIDFTYRIGRLYDKTGKFNEAIASYQKAVNLGKGTPYYYASNAALAIGRIYEARKDYNRAAQYFHEALAMKNHEYQNSTEYEAQQGLTRIHHQ
jgi:hypothetical protein